MGYLFMIPKYAYNMLTSSIIIIYLSLNHNALTEYKNYHSTQL